jgi:hypothetical protein
LNYRNTWNLHSDKPLREGLAEVMIKYAVQLKKRNEEHTIKSIIILEKCWDAAATMYSFRIPLISAFIITLLFPTEQDIDYTYAVQRAAIFSDNTVNLSHLVLPFSIDLPLAFGCALASYNVTWSTIAALSSLTADNGKVRASCTVVTYLWLQITVKLLNHIQ